MSIPEELARREERLAKLVEAPRSAALGIADLGARCKAVASQRKAAARMRVQMVTAEKMARAAKISPKRFRKALIARQFAWHVRNQRWIAEKDSPKYVAMLQVLESLKERGPA
jgi:hypothetical protein